MRPTRAQSVGHETGSGSATPRGKREVRSYCPVSRAAGCRSGRTERCHVVLFEGWLSGSRVDVWFGSNKPGWALATRLRAARERSLWQAHQRAPTSASTRFPFLRDSRSEASPGFVDGKGLPNRRSIGEIARPFRSFPTWSGCARDCPVQSATPTPCKSAELRTGQGSVLAGSPGHEGGDDVGGVAVEGDAGAVVAHRGPRVGVAGGLLHVPERHTGVEGGGFQQTREGRRTSRRSLSAVATAPEGRGGKRSAWNTVVFHAGAEPAA